MSETLLETRNVNLHFGAVWAAMNVNVAIEASELFFIIGQNGAGKSTFLNLCTGYLKPQSGDILFRGRPITGLPPRAITRAGIARAFQHPQIFEQRTVLNNVRFAVAAHERGFWRPWRSLADQDIDSRARELLTACRLERLGQLPAGKVAGGERKLLDVAMALALKPALLLLDEPTSGVSYANKYMVMATIVEVLRSCAVTAVVVEHDMEVVARFADRVGVWADGQIVAIGGATEILHDPAVKDLVL